MYLHDISQKLAPTQLDGIYPILACMKNAALIFSWRKKSSLLFFSTSEREGKRNLYIPTRGRLIWTRQYLTMLNVWYVPNIIQKLHDFLINNFIHRITTTNKQRNKIT